jgi:hypothetical protein
MAQANLHRGASTSGPIISREDLLSAKLAAGRPQDLADAAAIEVFAADEKSTPRKSTKR